MGNCCSWCAMKEAARAERLRIASWLEGEADRKKGGVSIACSVALREAAKEIRRNKVLPRKGFQ